MDEKQNLFNIKLLIIGSIINTLNIIFYYLLIFLIHDIAWYLFFITFLMIVILIFSLNLFYKSIFQWDILKISFSLLAVIFTSILWMVISKIILFFIS